ncbi:MAG: dienelactone hydrolase family protein [Nevskiaceae bacterium]|nr:MAG: dienelactone hydrolase family protein [Nevskiaceae bacterium]
MLKQFLLPLLTVAAATVSLPSAAAPVSKTVAYDIGDTHFEGRLVYDNASKKLRPALLMAPNWLGPTEAAFKQAQEIAGKDYVIFVADMYGTGVRPKNTDEAGAAAKTLYGDGAAMRARIAKALEVMKAQAGKAPIDLKRIGAIGFCFGGANVLELVRSGGDVAGVVTFHGSLKKVAGGDDQPIKAKILALHGADDPYVSADEVAGFEKEMRDMHADWQLVKFGNTVHSFTDPDSHIAGQADYNPVSAKRAFLMMRNFFTEVFAAQ